MRRTNINLHKDHKVAYSTPNLFEILRVSIHLVVATLHLSTTYLLHMVSSGTRWVKSPMQAQPTPTGSGVAIEQTLATAQREYPELVEMESGAMQLSAQQPLNSQAAGLARRGQELVFRKAENASRVQGEDGSATVY